MSSESQADSQPGSASESPVLSIALPKGGAAIRGIGEKFSTNAMTGTSALTAPLPISPARSGFQPQLSVAYDSGGGNGIVGLGWSVDLPSISLRTDKGLPQYRRADIYVLSGAEDLVSRLADDGRGGWKPDEVERDGYCIRFFRPRVEGLFARIERWTRACDGDVHWRSYTKDNVLTLYGLTEASRIADPRHPTHIFQWLIAASYDGKGNAIHYEYAAEDHRGTRCDRRGVNRYPKRVLYGNRKPVRVLHTPGMPFDAPPAAHEPDPDWMFELVFDYGDEGFVLSPGPDDEATVRLPDEGARPEWPGRSDPFSTYRSGFEIRTYRLCRRALTFHRFPAELGTPRLLTRSMEFQYEEKPSASLLTAIVSCGYRLQDDGSYLGRTLPALELEYTPNPMEADDPAPLELREAQSANLPEGVAGGNSRWLDLDGEGISGVLSEQGTGWYYKRNLGGGRFGALELVRHKPVSGQLGARQQFFDVRGAGQLNLVSLASGFGGFYERTGERDSAAGVQSGWGRFRPFRDFPVLDWADANLRFVDLTGDGVADILVTEDTAFRWQPSLREEGFGPAIRIPAPGDEREGPRVVFSDPQQSVYLADMSGDGLSDIVRIRNGEVCYWPNLGYGRFGRKIVMGGSPWFDERGLFDNRRIRLADTDGSGTTDVLYVTPDEIHIYLNQSGNSFSGRKTLRGVPGPATHSVSVVDFLGRGTACVVWSSSLPADAQRPLRYVDLMRGRKPYLLERVASNLGAETRLEYASSTEFYLADKAAGRPWLTPLPFPVHVVKRVETYDFISRTRLVSTNSYHHGYFDGVEREFRGFGRIDRTDSEEFDRTQPGAYPLGLNEQPAWRVPPILTKTWYHTGIFLDSGRLSRHLAHEYYHESAEPNQLLLADTVLPPGLTPDEAIEAARALKGTRLREEVYALDGSEAAARPYTVAESNATIRLLQPRGRNMHSVFFVHPREVATANYERKLYEIGGERRADPRVNHAITLEVDDFGNTLKSVTVAYGRRFAESSAHLAARDRLAQARTLATAGDNRYTNPVDVPQAYRGPMLAESRTFELIGLERETGARLLSFDEMRRLYAAAADGRHDLPFEDVEAKGATGPGPYRRLLQNARTIFRSDSLDRLLQLGELEPMALPGAGYSLALTPGLIANIYQNKLDDAQDLLNAACGYVDLDGDGNRWIPSSRQFYSPEGNADPGEELRTARRHFFLPRSFRDPFGNTSQVTYDAHDLLLVETRNPLGNVQRAQNDYRVLQPQLVVDANGNRSEASYDALGLIAGTALMGKAGAQEGDSLDGFRADLPLSEVLDHLRDPLANPHAALGHATSRVLYDLFAYRRTRHEAQPQPAATYTLTRETHVSDLAAGAQTRVQHAFAYSDGFARTVQKKIQAEPGPLPGASAAVDVRWVGSGWTVFNNKGKAVRQYEPFFSSTQQFEFAATAGVAATLIYDPLDRVAGTLNPNHTFQKTVFDPWRQETWDTNDTVLLNPADDADLGPLLRSVPREEYLPTWYDLRVRGDLGPREQEAAWKTSAHAGTPGLAYSDAQGRTFLSIVQNRFRKDDAVTEEFYPTRTELDIEGDTRAVTDSLGRVTMTYDYDLKGQKLHQNSADAGERWVLNEVAGKPVLTFDSRGIRLRYEYDELRRPLSLYLRAGDAAEKLVERAEYGEIQPDPESRNLRGRRYRQSDEAGIVTTPAYDFKGNLLRSTRQMLAEYRDTVDWAGSPVLEKETYSSETAYDALNRPVTLTAPDGSVVAPGYNEANLLETMQVSLKGQAGSTAFVTNIDYNAKGQRELIEYGNGVRSTASYDPLTFRLTQIRTSRLADGALLQDLSYTYDPEANICFVADEAQQTVFFKNQAVPASKDYIYDSAYRLIQASGREHAGDIERPWTDFEDLARSRLPLPGDGRAMRNYRERYRYDSAGNFLELAHASGQDGRWRRRYEYDEIEFNNRLSRTAVGQEIDEYAYDPAGNITRMLHLPSMGWDFKNQLASTRTQVVSADASPETTYYVYDSGGQRARKVTVDGTGRRRSDRLYLGGFEVYREYDGREDTPALERSTLHVTDHERRVALIESRGDEQTIRYQFDDHLGSCCLELDEDAAVISYEEYYPFGSTSYQAGRSVAEVSLKRYRFTGKERDTETGFYYHGSRYMAPWLGRWMSCDPAGNGSSAYIYGGNDPVDRSDPTGNWDISLKHVLIGAAVAIVVVGAVALTAGAAAPVIAAGLAEAGLSAGTITALGEATVATGVVMGVSGTAETANEISTGRSATGEKLTDEQRSERLGALPVQVLATAFGIRGISGGGGGGASGLRSLAPALAEGLAEENTIGPFIRPFTNPGTASVPALITAAPTTVGTLVGAGVVPGALAMMSSGGDNPGGSSDSGSGSGGGASSTPEPPPTSEDIGPRIESLPEDDKSRLLSRVVRGDNKGRPFGTPRNPRLPTVEEFNPRIDEVRAGDLEEAVTGTKHGIFPEQAESIRGLSNEDLVRFRMEDPISAASGESGLSLTGGHHRTAEIITRVSAGKLDPNTVVRVLVHD